MTQRQIWIAGLGLAALVVWLARPSNGATIKAADIRTVAVALPRSYGELRAVDRSSLYFENVDGTIHIVHLTLDGEVDQNVIEVTRQ